MNKRLLFVVLLNLVIGFSYYIENLDAGFTTLSSDSNNIIPICQKLDNPDFFKRDLYLNDINNVKYYTPFYISILRFLHKITDKDYVQSSNILFFIIHVFYGLFWFLIFYKYLDDFWIAVILSVMIRGIVWLPGMEMWGISDLWSLMPRTVYATLLPLPFLFMNFKDIKYLYFSAFLIGFILNFHPITGLGGILIYILILFFETFKGEKKIVKKIIIPIFFIFIGMLPFVFNYFNNTSNLQINQELYNKAFSSRIPNFFSNPLLFMQKWLKIRYLFFVIPLLALAIISIFDGYAKKVFYLLIFIVFFVLFLPFLSFYIESFINNRFNLNLRLSFQLLRIQKLAILPSYFAIGYLIIIIEKKIKLKKLTFILFLLYSLVLIVSKNDLLKNIPLVGDDITKLILPNNLSQSEVSFGKKQQDLEEMLIYINNNVSKDALFVGPSVIRSATKNSVQYDTKGASMLIEGNQKRFIKWYKDMSTLKSLSYADKINFYRNNDVGYILSKNKISELTPIKTTKTWFLYKL